MSIEISKKMVGQIMSLNAPVVATGESAGGYLGAIGPRQQALLDLKKETAAYVTEAQKPSPDMAKIKDQLNKIEGGVQGIHAYNIINDQKLNEIIELINSLDPH